MKNPKFKNGACITYNRIGGIAGRIWQVESNDCEFDHGYRLKLISVKHHSWFKLERSYSFTKEFIEGFYKQIDDIDVITIVL